MPICKNCSKHFPNYDRVNGKTYNYTSRKFCPECSPIGSNNTRSYIIQLEENESFCVRCKKTKDKTNFYKRKSSGRPFSYCIECQIEVKELKLKEKLERLVEENDGICADCGMMFPAIIYEFYSDRNGAYQISKIKNMSLEKIKQELNGYIMLCRNCSAMRQWIKND